MAKATTQSPRATDRAQELLAELETGVHALVSGEDWQAWLELAAKLHRYSFRNTLLIHMQRPDATACAGYKDWQRASRQVRRGERGIGILAPMTAKRMDDDGIERAFLIGFRGTVTFDISQTDGSDVGPILPALLEGEAPEGAWDILADLVASKGYGLERGECHGANGYTRPDTPAKGGTVRVRSDVDDAQALKTLAHELGHILCGHTDDETLTLYQGCRGQCEVEAESVAYIVTRSLGMEASGYSFPYVGHWSEGKPEAVSQSGERIVRAARTITEALSHLLSEEGRVAPKVA